MKADVKAAKAYVKAEAKAEAKAANLKVKTSTPKKEIITEDEAQLFKDIIVDMDKSIHETEKQLGAMVDKPSWCV